MYRRRNSMPSLPESVIEAGMEHGRRAFNVELNRHLLALLYDKTRARREHFKCTFYEARAWALSTRLSQRTPEEQHRYRAYCGALGKMGNALRQLNQRKAEEAKKPEKRSPQQRIKDHVALGIDGRQYEFILSNSLKEF